MKPLVRMQLTTAIWNVFDMPMNMAVRGIILLVGTQPVVAIWNVFGMPMNTNVRGMKPLVSTLLDSAG
jgi:hypothetical protein